MLRIFKGDKKLKLRLFGTANDSIVDGPGIRYAVFVQGCTHNCKGCHNPESHNIDGGFLKDTDEIFEEIKKNPLLDGVTFSGGEPFLQAKPLTVLAKKIKESGLNLYVYSGFTFEQLTSGANEENGWMELLKQADFLVDGKFEEDKKHYTLLFKGSENQRIIDVQSSFKENKTIIIG